MKTRVEIDPRSINTWPIRLDTDAGPVYLTISEAENLVAQLEVALITLDPIRRQSDNEFKLAA